MKFTLRCIESTEEKSTFRLYGPDYIGGIFSIKADDIVDFIGNWQGAVLWDGKIPPSVKKLAVEAWGKKDNQK